MCIRISVQRGVLLSRWALTLKWLARVQKKEMAEPLIKMCCILLDVRVVSDVEVHGLSSNYVTEQVLSKLIWGGIAIKILRGKFHDHILQKLLCLFSSHAKSSQQHLHIETTKVHQRKTIESFVQRHQVFLCFGLHSYSYDMSGKHPP